MPPITTDTLNPSDVRALRARAVNMGDLALVAICDLALEGEVNAEGLSPMDARQLRQMTRADAIVSCVDAIEEIGR